MKLQASESIHFLREIKLINNEISNASTHLLMTTSVHAQKQAYDIQQYTGSMMLH